MSERIEFTQHSGKSLGGKSTHYYPIDVVRLDGRFIGMLYRKTNHFALHVPSNTLSDSDHKLVADVVAERLASDVYISRRPDDSDFEAALRITRSKVIATDLGDDDQDDHTVTESVFEE